MDNDDLALESELKALRPRGPSARLLARLDRPLRADLRPPPPGPAFDVARWLGWAAAAAFVAGFTSLAFHPPPTHPPQADAGYPAPARVENVVLAAADEGFVTLDDGTPARRYRIRSVDTFTWTPAPATSLTWKVPREDVRFIPINTY